jgi:hypothetical protein
VAKFEYPKTYPASSQLIGSSMCTQSRKNKESASNHIKHNYCQIFQGENDRKKYSEIDSG